MTEERNFDAHGGGRFGAFVALPGKLPAPALVLLQEVYGVNRFMRRITEYWAAQGFMAVCPDVYWRLKPGIVLDPETPGHREQALETGGRLDVDLAVRDIAGLVEQLHAAKECSGRVATAGYCLGGKLAYLVGTRGGADCNVSYYGVGIEIAPGRGGEAERSRCSCISARAIRGRPRRCARGCGTRWAPARSSRMHVYPDTGHAFAREGAATDVPAMRELANGRTRAFLEANLR